MKHATRVLPQAQQRERHTDVVVEVALGRKGTVALPRMKDRRDHLRHGGLAVAAGHRNQRQRAAAAPSGGKGTERQTAVGNLESHEPGTLQPVFSDGGHGTRRTSCCQVVMPVVALAPKCDEEVSRQEAARVGVNALETQRAVSVQRRGGHEALCVGKAHHE